MTKQLTKSHRRQFLQRSLLGAMSISFVPAAVSSLFYEHDLQDPVLDLLNKLLFKKLPLKSVGVLPGKEPNTTESQLKQSVTGVYNLGKTLCIRHEYFSITGRKDWLVDFYEESSGIVRKVVTLNPIEVRTLSRMIPILQNKYNINQPEELRALIIPRQMRSASPTYSSNAALTGISKDGYTTKFGHCSIRIMAEGSRLNIYASLQDKSKKNIYGIRLKETYNA